MGSVVGATAVPGQEKRFLLEAEVDEVVLLPPSEHLAVTKYRAIVTSGCVRIFSRPHRTGHLLKELTLSLLTGHLKLSSPVVSAFECLILLQQFYELSFLSGHSSLLFWPS